jgi:hypothetical protein
MLITAVINDKSLLVQGIISHLRHSAPTTNVQVVEIGIPDVVDKLIALQPEVVILESGLSSSAICPLNRLFVELPRLVVIEVNIQTSNIQIIRSNQYKAAGVADLLNILENASGNPPVVFPLP